MTTTPEKQTGTWMKPSCESDGNHMNCGCAVHENVRLRKRLDRANDLITDMTIAWSALSFVACEKKSCSVVAKHFLEKVRLWLKENGNG